MSVSVTTTDEKTFSVPSHLVKYLVTISNMLEDVPENSESIPLTDADSEIFELVIKYITWYDATKPTPGTIETLYARPLQDWEKEFMKNIMKSPRNVKPGTDEPENGQFLFQMIVASGFLNCKVLTECLVFYGKEYLENHTAEEIREHFCIAADPQ